jgi:hypothetical protein
MKLAGRGHSSPQFGDPGENVAFPNETSRGREIFFVKIPAPCKRFRVSEFLALNLCVSESHVTGAPTSHISSGKKSSGKKCTEIPL